MQRVKQSTRTLPRGCAMSYHPPMVTQETCLRRRHAYAELRGEKAVAAASIEATARDVGFIRSKGCHAPNIPQHQIHLRGPRRLCGTERNRFSRKLCAPSDTEAKRKLAPFRRPSSCEAPRV